MIMPTSRHSSSAWRCPSTGSPPAPPIRPARMTRSPLCPTSAHDDCQAIRRDADSQSNQCRTGHIPLLPPGEHRAGSRAAVKVEFSQLISPSSTSPSPVMSLASRPSAGATPTIQRLGENRGRRGERRRAAWSSQSLSREECLDEKVT
jgi:hypothetical protein